jgi:hypothetical protein
MTISDHPTLRAVILPAGAVRVEDLAARRLLKDLGHTVAGAGTPNQALELLNQDDTDLLIVDVTDSQENRAFVDRLADLPDPHRPREVAIFSNWIDKSLDQLRKRLEPSRVHVFLKPLHMHGLLTVLRQMDHGDHETADA